MLPLLFVFLLISMIWRLIILSIRATWGISKILLRICFFPLVLLAAALGGLLKAALILAAIVCLLSFLSRPKITL